MKHLITDVLIVGAGPTGLMAANQCQRFGINFLIIDSKDGPTHESRALAVTPRSMELYQQLGLANEIMQNACTVQGFSLFRQGKKFIDRAFPDYGKRLSDFHGFLIIYEQNKNEAILTRHLSEQGKHVLWNHEFIHLDTKDDHIIVLAKNADDGKVTIKTSYVIACDGAKSPIRHQLAVPFEGGTYENKFFVADVDMIGPFEHTKVSLCPSDTQGLIGIFPLKEDQHYRLVGTLPSSLEGTEHISSKVLEKLIHDISQITVTCKSVNRYSIYKLHHRCVDNFQHGRVFFAGDSAHIHTPAGGQGMNTGLQDVHNLVWKLSSVLRDGADESLLLTYNEERLPFAHTLLYFTDRAFTLLVSKNWFTILIRKYIIFPMMSFVTQFTKVQVYLAQAIGQLAYTYRISSLSSSHTKKQGLSFKAGDRLPYLHHGMYTDFAEPCFYCVSIGKHKNHDNEIEIKGVLSTIPLRIKHLHYPIIEWLHLGVNKPLCLIVRPDQYVGLICDTLDQKTLYRYMKQFYQQNSKKT